MLMPRRLFQATSNNKPSFSRPSFFFSILVCFLLVLPHGSITAADTETTKVGAIINDDSRVGKEQKIAVEVAVQNFNNTLTRHNLELHVQNPGTHPLQAAYSAEELIKDKKVQVIIGTESWDQTALVADIGSRIEVPLLSLAASAITPPMAAIRWPFLVQMAPNGTEQVNCIAAILRSFRWKRVITIYEDDMYGGGSGILALLSEAIQSAGSEIEHRLAFPPFSSLSDPEEFVRKEVSDLLQRQSRVFIVLQSSLSLASNLFREAKQLGLVEKDSVWILSDSVSDLLDSVDSSVISSMQGALGIQTYFPEKTNTFLDFKRQFQKKFRAEYPEEDNSKPGFHAVRAYDAITTIAQAVEKTNSNNRTSKVLLENILSTNFHGLSGNIRFNNRVVSEFPTFRIINVIGKMYEELGFWSSKFGFSDSLAGERNRSENGGDSMEVWADSVNWPGKLNRVPKGWTMPTDAKPMRIVIPGRTSFEKFVKVDWNNDNPNERYSGYCIDLFEELLKILEQSYPFPYEFYPVNDTYDGLIYSVINKTYDAIVGDITILANRSRYVEYTQPYAESGLSMVVPVKPDNSRAWIFTKPFTKEMWVVTGLVMVYTMLVVWFLEHQTNPEFSGPWKNQLSNTLWFTFSSLFFAHREKIHSNYSRVVVAVWLFVVFVVTSSYTASLTSMLTVTRLEPTLRDIEWVRRNNAVVGCDGDSFVKNYLKNVLDFKEENIEHVSSEYNYPGKLESGRIKAAFLELPYEKVFLKEYCNKFTATGPVYRFGGLGFVFQKGSPIAADVSEAILTISENGVLKSLEEKWFEPSSSCSNLNSTAEVDSLNLQSFWGLYVISGTTSTICLILFLAHLLRKYFHHIHANQGNLTPSSGTFWGKIVRFARYFYIGSVRVASARTPGSARSVNGQAPDVENWNSAKSSARWELVSPSETAEQPETFRPPEIEIPVRIR